MPPTPKNGKICYIEIPALEVRRSSEFYEKVFRWGIRTRGDGSIAFDDATGQVSGSWILGRPSSASPGLLLYIMVDNIQETIDPLSPTVVKSSSRSEVTRRKLTARFREPRRKRDRSLSRTAH